LRNFAELSEREILALAIALKEDDGRIYAEYAHVLAENFLLPPKFSRKWLPRRTSIAAG
jgi:hypothetical protein